MLWSENLCGFRNGYTVLRHRILGLVHDTDYTRKRKLSISVDNIFSCEKHIYSVSSLVTESCYNFVEFNFPFTFQAE